MIVIEPRHIATLRDMLAELDASPLAGTMTTCKRRQALRRVIEAASWTMVNATPTGTNGAPFALDAWPNPDE